MADIDDQLHETQGAANDRPGPRAVPARIIPVPDTLGPEGRALVEAPYRSPDWDADGRTPEGWRALVAEFSERALPLLRRVRKALGVSVEPTQLNDVPCHMVTPAKLPPSHKGRVILAIHGGGFVFNPGESGTGEAVLMSGIGEYRVVSVDYRMPPAAPFPAAIDDVMAVYRALLKTYKPSQIAICGSSAGGALTLLAVQRALREGLPVPGAIAPGTPAADLSETGDTYRTHEWLDNVIVSFSGYISRAARLYAEGRDLKDPLLSAIYGDFAGFPPAILTSGTRDLFLSSTVRVHRALRAVGVDAQLHVYEGLSHCQYMMDPKAPETHEAFSEIAAFCDRTLSDDRC